MRRRVGFWLVLVAAGAAALLAAPTQQAALAPSFPGSSYVGGCGFSHRTAAAWTARTASATWRTRPAAAARDPIRWRCRR